MLRMLYCATLLVAVFTLIGCEDRKSAAAAEPAAAQESRKASPAVDTVKSQRVARDLAAAMEVKRVIIREGTLKGLAAVSAPASVLELLGPAEPGQTQADIWRIFFSFAYILTVSDGSNDSTVVVFYHPVNEILVATLFKDGQMHGAEVFTAQAVTNPTTPLQLNPLWYNLADAILGNPYNVMAVNRQLESVIHERNWIDAKGNLVKAEGTTSDAEGALSQYDIAVSRIARSATLFRKLRKGDESFLVEANTSWKAMYPKTKDNIMRWLGIEQGSVSWSPSLVWLKKEDAEKLQSLKINNTFMNIDFVDKLIVVWAGSLEQPAVAWAAVLERTTNSPIEVYAVVWQGPTKSISQ